MCQFQDKWKTNLTYKIWYIASIKALSLRLTELEENNIKIKEIQRKKQVKSQENIEAVF